MPSLEDRRRLIMAKNVVEVSHAVAEAVRLCEPDVTPIYPITPQSN